jgi:hypothetical protein
MTIAFKPYPDIPAHFRTDKRTDRDLQIEVFKQKVMCSHYIEALDLIVIAWVSAYFTGL